MKAERTREGADTAALAAEYARSRDPALRDILVQRHLYLSSMIAARFSGRGVDYEDLYQVASLALVRALEKFDPSRGLKLTTYLTPSMIGEVKNYFRDRSRLIRLPRTSAERMREMEQAVEAFAAENRRQPTVPELAQRLDWDEETVLETLELRGAARPSSLDGALETEEGETSLSDYLGAEETGYAAFENKDALKRAMEALTGDERRVILLRFFENLSQRDAAAKLGVSQMSVSRTERRALSKLREQMQDVED